MTDPSDVKHPAVAEALDDMDGVPLDDALIASAENETLSVEGTLTCVKTTTAFWDPVEVWSKAQRGRIYCGYVQLTDHFSGVDVLKRQWSDGRAALMQLTKDGSFVLPESHLKDLPAFACLSGEWFGCDNTVALIGNDHSVLKDMRSDPRVGGYPNPP